MLQRPNISGNRGAVASTHWLASQAGMAMFERDGNAFDAAVAGAFVLQVVEPHLNGPASDVPILLYEAGSGDVRVICGQGPMPAAATIGRFRAAGLTSIPGSGLLPACVPGAFGAWMTLLQRYGRLTVADVLAPAISYARHGYPLLPKAAGMIDELALLFREEWTESGRTYLVDGRAPRPYARMRNPVLADVYERIVGEACAAGPSRDSQIDGAVRAFYQGFVAEAIDDYVSTATPIDSTGRRNGGLLTGADLAGWAVDVEDSASVDFAGYTVHKPGFWTQGPVFLQQLRMLDGFDLPAMGFGSPEHMHTVVESAKLAFADREAWYGDPAFVAVPAAELLSGDYAAVRRDLISFKASGDLLPGAPAGVDGWIPALPESARPPADPAWMEQIADGIPAVVARTAAKGDTCCVTAVDADGNLVVATPSGGWLKSSPVVPGLGFALGTRGQMALLVDGHHNSLAPGKRPRTTLSPTLVVRDGRPVLAFGTPGGDQQDQWTMNFFLNHVKFGMGLQAATEAPTFHTEHLVTSFAPRQIRLRSVIAEPALDSAFEELRRRGHEVKAAPAQSLGKVCATGISADGLVTAAASQRGEQAYAIAR